MVINIKKSIAWENVYLVVLNAKKEENRRIYLDFNDNLATFEIDLSKDSFVYFENEENKSEIIILSEGLCDLELFYNENTKRTTCNFYVNNCEDYGTVSTYKLRDFKHFGYRSYKSKIINIFTPSNYDENKEYGLILMFDSQNIFDINKFGNYTHKQDPYGGWQVESSLENIAHKYNDEYIIVGIDNAEKIRMLELTAKEDVVKFKSTFFTDLGVPKRAKKYFSLDKLGEFITKTLLPSVFSKYKIKKYNIGICGSSAGGNAALYLGMKYSNIFRFIFTLTPSIGFYTDDSLINFFKLHVNDELPQPEIYYFQGLNCDLEKLLGKLNTNLIENLEKAGIKKENITTYIEPTADHNEDPWRYVFNYFLSLHAKNSNEY